jgi:hypothetical protein
MTIRDISTLTDELISKIDNFSVPTKTASKVATIEKKAEEVVFKSELAESLKKYASELRNIKEGTALSYADVNWYVNSLQGK